jgi:hypothetical protein
MRISSLTWLGFVPSGVFAQEVFESTDFNVTEALLKNGVDVSAIPELSGLSTRSLSSSCSIAVSPCSCQDYTIDGRSIKLPKNPCQLISETVQLSQDYSRWR